LRFINLSKNTSVTGKLEFREWTKDKFFNLLGGDKGGEEIREGGQRDGRNEESVNHLLW
jgi:hypothetical protein